MKITQQLVPSPVASAGVLAACLLAAGCAPTRTDTAARAPVAGPTTPSVQSLSALSTRDVAIPFRAVVGGDPFTCGTRYTVNGTGMEGRDLRFYVSDVRLVGPDGVEVPVLLEQDGLWQYETLALLDFEDGTTGCRNGTPQTRDKVTGTVPEGAYSSVRFVLGVPEHLNHINQATAPSPLSLTALFWSWNAGYKFLRAEVLSDGLPQGFFVHLGSTHCLPEGRATAPATSCGNANRLEVELPFDPDQADHVVFDLAALLEGTALTGSEEVQRGACMSSPQDARCAPVFSALGLPFPDVSAGEQRVFRVVRGSVTTAAGS